MDRHGHTNQRLLPPARRAVIPHQPRKVTAIRKNELRYTRSKNGLTVGGLRCDFLIQGEELGEQILLRFESLVNEDDSVRRGVGALERVRAGHLSRLGKRRMEFCGAKGPRGPSERARASPFEGAIERAQVAVQIPQHLPNAAQTQVVEAVLRNPPKDAVAIS